MPFLDRFDKFNRLISLNNRPTRIVIHSLVTLLGAVAGAMVGFYTTLAIVVLKARFGHYLFGIQELAAFRLETVTLFAGLIVGAVLAYQRPYRLWRALLRGMVGMIGGAAVGAGVGLLLWGSSEGLWTGGIIGSALGLLIVTGLALHHIEGRKPSYTDLGAGSIIALTILVAVIIGLRDPLAVEVPEIEPAPLPPASDVDEVVFIVGDAGATIEDGSPLLDALQYDIEHWSAMLARDSTVAIAYAGDLVYPVGVRDRDHPEYPVDSLRIWNQIDLVSGPMARRYHSLGLLTPGNHDWGNSSGQVGIDRIFNLEAELAQARAQGRAVMLMPPAGDPGPAIRDVRDNVRMVFIDTHWFLQAQGEEARTDFLAGLADALANAGDRHVIIVSHHPYQSAGPHGAIIPGLHNWGVGYLMRKAGALVQDLNAPVYEELLDGMRQIFAALDRPPLVFAGGHDHSLQVLERQIDSDPAYMLVSGSGSKITDIRTLPNMHYGAGRPGYMKLLFRKNGAVDLFVIAGEPALLKCTAEDPATRQSCMTVGANQFEIVYGKTIAAAPDVPLLSDSTATPDADASPRPPDARQAEASDSDETVANVATTHQPTAPGSPVAWWTSKSIPPTDPIAETDEPMPVPPPAVPARVLYFAPDSVVTTAGASYEAGGFQRVVLGNLNRHLWDVPVRIPVLDLDALGGSVVVEELTGGMQTVGLRMEGSTGVTYQFRNMVKDGTRGLEGAMQEQAAGILQDQLAAQFPLGAMVVAAMLEDAGILVATPRLVVMPNDDRLGAFRPYFAGRVGWIEERPNEADGDRPGFAGSRKIVGNETIFEALRESPGSYVNPQTFLRARLIDFLVGDWDRHQGNWRWARFDDGDGPARWEPIPRDRDWAFSRADGLITNVTAMVFPRMVGFGDAYPAINRLAGSGYRLDHRILGVLDRAAFEVEARRLQALFTDDRLRAALDVLPPEYRAIEYDRLLQSLQARRAALVGYAGEFFDLISETVHVHGYEDVVDHVVLTTRPNGQMHVRAWIDGQQDTPYFDRTLDPARTKELRLYLDPATDQITRPEVFPAIVTLATPGDDDDEKRDY